MSEAFTREQFAKALTEWLQKDAERGWHPIEGSDIPIVVAALRLASTTPPVPASQGDVIEAVAKAIYSVDAEEGSPEWDTPLEDRRANKHHAREQAKRAIAALARQSSERATLALVAEHQRIMDWATAKLDEETNQRKAPEEGRDPTAWKHSRKARMFTLREMIAEMKASPLARQPTKGEAEPLAWYAVDEVGNDNFATSIYENENKGLLVARCNQNGNYPWQAASILQGLAANKAAHPPKED